MLNFAVLLFSDLLVNESKQQTSHPPPPPCYYLVSCGIVYHNLLFHTSGVLDNSF